MAERYTNLICIFLRGVHFLQDVSVFGQILHKIMAGEAEVGLHCEQGFDTGESESVSFWSP